MRELHRSAARGAREAALTARSQPVASTLTAAVIAGMVVAVMLTTGRAVASERQVLASIDSAGTRTVTIRAEDAAGVTSDVLDRIRSLEGIEWAGAFSAAVDATNTAVPGGTAVPVRQVYGSHLGRLGVPATSPVPDAVAYASPQALTQLGMVDGAGAVTMTTGATYPVAGRLTVPQPLSSLEPLVLVPQRTPTGAETVNVVVVVVDRPGLVAPVGDAVVSVLGAEDPSKVSVQTSEAFAQLRALVAGQLGSSSRGLVLAVLTVTGALVAMLLYGLVMMRRKDFGRRRALGATRRLIAALVLLQTLLLSSLGALLGALGSSLYLLLSGGAQPGIAFTGALCVLAVATAVLAALLPALMAGRRDPMRELRVP